MIIWDHNGENNYENPLGMHFSKKKNTTPSREGNVAYACVIDGNVIDTSIANPEYWAILESNYELVDITSQYDVDEENAYVLKFVVNGEEKLIVGVTKRYGAILLSDPEIVKLHNARLHSNVEIGWEYKDGVFTCPPDFDPYSDQYY